ncbi:MAG: acyl-ACP--UDP-N-acetylglucosamine O-acyltransferase [Pirellulales bacterium]|nr:acyl-ACP--UDP-N-acetylglucosamine O-acyltransferase [Pirellulales bacterium]
MQIHPLAVVSPFAQLGQGVSIGPYCVIEPDVTIGDSCQISARVSIKSGTVLGPNNTIAEGTVVGGAPQHLKAPERTGGVVIGTGNVIRENCTIHRALAEGRATRLGNHNLMMVNAHVAHDCAVGNNVVLANNVMLAGHVTVDDRAFISGAVGVHQFCRIGRCAMVGGQAHIIKDVAPYVTIDGASSMVVGLNLLGLRRAGFSDADITQLKQAYRLIYRSGLRWTEILEQLETQFATGPASAFHEFFRGTTRGCIHERRMPQRATIRLRRDTSNDKPAADETDHKHRRAA